MANIITEGVIPLEVEKTFNDREQRLFPDQPTIMLDPEDSFSKLESRAQDAVLKEAVRVAELCESLHTINQQIKVLPSIMPLEGAEFDRAVQLFHARDTLIQTLRSAGYQKSFDEFNAL